MPELPEVETVRCGLVSSLEGRVLRRVTVRRAGLRKPFPNDFAARLTDARVIAVRRRAKYLLVDLSSDETLIWHLGMSGQVRIEGEADVKTPLGAHDHVVFETDRGVRVVFRDPRRFGLMALCATADVDRHPLLEKLGPEPTDRAFDGAFLAARLRGRKTSIKAALMDQSIIAGLGNIYVCESLYRAGLSPRRSAHTVQGGRATRLADAVRAVIAEAIAAGGSSLRDHRQTNGELGYFQHRFAVYGRVGERCPDCTCTPSHTGGIRRIVQNGRSTFYCATRQR
ncbi:bifunctional DNA-formamidopyrimidine glycosylase/DNA-(apurinic or apyrimidinic site) lyase [Varunaivibrio sulfuroxidans]|uniref:Formamidopyrimidine-DNA glycosylase n=1 Tax=Varunaivibrio sulfuroxidans TaxID=1773489 RepID=A0A4R3JG43_9PROT|nr:bifunctional DNA-formamidopyrimidine glycosylase/DNA-(apurinic or apyrimidinic site) lyase [Varunaivibrio sulfuroxidans]TCS65119.1 DNA-(apurinic or apyrimidinic site) lyase [Varunaivibrio sulfuroxidans]WES29594.1 bifunctional DNA-formamidopyrimidine glycosylase/DNA-(apurinic or apyrimidinic site) lyase [Varunaivibrio sulfuroxidans]